MLTPDELTDITRELWQRHETELLQHDRAYDYVRGLRGRPDVPEGAGDELKDIAKDSVKNVLGIVVDSFAQNLAVNGFRSPEQAEDDPAWEWWQAQRLDARQQDVHRPTLTYGSGYASLSPDGDVRLRTPRSMFTAYADPTADLWPIYGIETWIDYTDRQPVRLGRFSDDEFEYLVDLGTISRVRDAEYQPSVAQRLAIREVIDTTPHGAGVCPIVRFINTRDAEDVVVGEVAPLIRAQRSLNAVNFDRLVVSRYGAFPQRYAIGWAPSSPSELVKASMANLMAFDDDTVKVGAFPAASVEGYNSIISEMLTHVAMEAQIPLSAFGSMANLSADALAMAEAPHQRKLKEKRESLGESWEQLIRLAGQMNGYEVDPAAEVTWRETESRSFAQVVDGIVKLNQAGVPIEELLSEIPGWSKQRVDSARAALRRSNGAGGLASVLERTASRLTSGDPQQPA